MSDRTSLRLLTPLKHVSPFDVNMAADAGFDVLSSYTGVTLAEVTGLVQDAMFSRPPKLGLKTGVFIGGKAGTQVLSAGLLKGADSLLIVADVNAVPPAGIEGVAANADGEKIGGSNALGLGALAIGAAKYQTQSGLLKQMLKAEKPVVYDFRDAFVLARTLAQ